MSEPSRKNIFKSMFAVQKTLSAVSKSGSNPHLKTAYATLPDVLEELLPKCHEAGLFISHRQMECDTPGMIRVELMV
ncbi:MAG: hypothetical protein EBR82_65685, partial [Caulobacteraceae bacterium]|nr:hypothetical protein [Caulobacteraceae bacterium]